MNVNKLQPGQSIKISECNSISVHAERSGDGKTLRYYRQTPNGFTVFKTCTF